MKKVVQRRGLSDVVTTVLIILLALVAVAIIGGVVVSNVNKSGAQAEALSLCQNLDVQYSDCQLSPLGVTLDITRNSDTMPTKMNLIFTDSTGKVVGSSGALAYPAAAASAQKFVTTNDAALAGVAPATTTGVKVLHIVASGGGEYDCKVPTQQISCSSGVAPVNAILNAYASPGLIVETVDSGDYGDPEVGISCGSGNTDCTETYTSNQDVYLRASGGASFAAWGGDGCDNIFTYAQPDDICKITLSVPSVHTISALRTYNLNVIAAGSNNIISNPPGIDCGTLGASCSASFLDGSEITLEQNDGANPPIWSGCTSVSGDICTVILTNDMTVTAGD